MNLLQLLQFWIYIFDFGLNPYRFRLGFVKGVVIEVLLSVGKISGKRVLPIVGNMDIYFDAQHSQKLLVRNSICTGCHAGICLIFRI